MSAPGDGNGNGAAAPSSPQLDTVVLTYDRAADRLEIGGHAHSFDLILDMLARATRMTEFQVRKQQALEIQAAAREAAENARIAAALRNGR